MTVETDAPRPVRVWDLPTRAFHWLLAGSVIGSVISANVGGDAMRWHFWLGYVSFTLIGFRILWGLVGGHWSRFVRFIYAPRTMMRFARGKTSDDEQFDVGHSPLGALSVFGMLAILALQIGTGLIADDEITNVGPLNRFVDSATAASATAWHKEVGQWLLLGLVGLHLLVVAFYSWRGKRIVGAMVGGDKLLPPGTPASVDNKRSRLKALVLLLVCAAGVTWVVCRGG